MICYAALQHHARHALLHTMHPWDPLIHLPVSPLFFSFIIHTRMLREALSNGVGWLLGAEDGSAATQPRSVVGSLPLPSFQHPGHAMLEHDGYKQQLYTVFRQRALEERKEHGTRGEHVWRVAWQARVARCMHNPPRCMHVHANEGIHTMHRALGCTPPRVVRVWPVGEGQHAVSLLELFPA